MFAASVIIPWIIATILLVGVAVGVVYMLAVSRRTPHDWQQHVKDQSQSFGQTPLSAPSDSVTPQTVSLHGMLHARIEEGNAYYNPTSLPGFERLEGATERIEQRIADQRSKENEAE